MEENGKYQDHQYNKVYQSSYLNEVKDNKGNTISASETKLQHYQINLANTQGMKKMKTKKLGDIHDIIVKSNIDARLYTYITTNQSMTSKLLKRTTQAPIDVKYLSGLFDVTDRKIQKFLSEADSLDFIKKINKEFYLNPYLVQPFKTTNNMLHQLQIWWDSNPSLEIVFVSKEDLMASMVTNTKKIIEDKQ